MAQGYLNLTEAAKTLGMMPDELRQMAQKNQIRSFQDRGTLRFRVADIQEMARRRGATSDPDLVLAEPKSGPRTPAPPKSAPPKSTPPKSTPPQAGPKSPASPRSKKPVVDAPEIFDFALDTGDDKLDIGHEVLSDSGSKSGPRSPKKSAGSDSDVKLVVPMTGPDSDVKLLAGGPKSPQGKAGAGPISPGPNKSSRLATGPQGVDSGVRLVTTDSDSDVKIVGTGGGGSTDEVALGAAPSPSSSDSDIRLEKVVPPPKSSEEMLLTEEINLDEELKKQEAAQRHKPKSRVKPKSEVKFPTQSPFELSDSDLDRPTEMTDKPLSSPSGINLSPAPPTPKPASSGSIVLESSDDFSLELPDDNVMGSSDEGKLTGPSSGISLSNPVDAGISLEEGSESSDQLDLDMSLDVGGTPKPAKGQPVGDSSSEFELSLDAAAAGKNLESDSEFDLTLDDSGEAQAAPQAKAGKKGEKDIFETDFDVPALEGDSGSEVAALETGDTELESSDFDLALDDSDLAVEDESGSQVVALDEESADEAAETLAGELGEELVVEEGSEEEEGVATGPVREVVRDRIIEPAPWGALPTVFMAPCVIVMILVGIMGFELIQSSAGYRSAGFVTKALGDMVGFKTR